MPSPAPSGTRIGTIEPARLLIIHAFIALIVAGSLSAVVLDRELWPFSNYPMYSELHPGSYTTRQLIGVVDGREVALTNYEYWAPLGPSRMAKAFVAFEAMRDDPTRTERVLEGLARRYEERRVGGIHRGPRISALRLYEVSWRIESDASGGRRPDYRRLLAEDMVDVED
jgi:hypothetical protein